MNCELDAEKKLQALIAKDRIRIKEFFIDFDKLRKGYVGEAAFRTCLGTLNIRFTEQEVQQLIAKYRMQNGLINYDSFCTNIDNVFFDGADPMGVINNAKSSANFDEEEMQTLFDLLNAIKTEIVQKRVLIKPQF